MRLGLDIRELQRGRRTGIGRYLRHLIEYVSRQRPGHELFFYANQTTDTREVDGCGRVRVLGERLTLWWDQVQLVAAAAEDGLEVFLSPYIKGPVRIHCPLAITVHDLMFLAWPGYARAGQLLRNALIRRMGAWVGRRADVVFTDSQYSAGDIVRFLGLSRERIRVLPIGVDAAYVPVEAATAVVADAYELREEYLLYVGNYKPHKNVGALIRAYAGLPEAYRRRYALVLAGRVDDGVAALRAEAARLRVGARVRFLGMVAERYLPALLSAATLFVFPSLYEGFGLPPLEAMACGTAVVASSLTSVPEVVGDAGLLVDPRETVALSGAMERVLSDTALRDELEEKGLARARRFRAEALCAQQLEILEGLA